MEMVIWRALTPAVRSPDQRVPRAGRRPDQSGEQSRERKRTEDKSGRTAP